MSGFFARQAARALGMAPAIRLRYAQRFEGSAEGEVRFAETLPGIGASREIGASGRWPGEGFAAEKMAESREAAQSGAEGSVPSADRLPDGITRPIRPLIRPFRGTPGWRDAGRIGGTEIGLPGKAPGLAVEALPDAASRHESMNTAPGATPARQRNPFPGNAGINPGRTPFGTGKVPAVAAARGAEGLARQGQPIFRETAAGDSSPAPIPTEKPQSREMRPDAPFPTAEPRADRHGHQPRRLFESGTAVLPAAPPRAIVPASPAAGPLRAAAPAVPDISVEIGRIVVEAAKAAQPAPRPARSAPVPRRSLRDYLRDRERQ